MEEGNPFNETDGTSKLGEIDVAFLASYSLGMSIAGHLGDTLDLRLFLTFGTHSPLRGDSRALATVTAIIDGTGSVGAALGPLITGFLSSKGWDAVFIMLAVCAIIAALLLSHLVIAECNERMHKPIPSSHGQQTHEATGEQPLLGNQR